VAAQEGAELRGADERVREDRARAERDRRDRPAVALGDQVRAGPEPMRVEPCERREGGVVVGAGEAQGDVPGPADGAVAVDGGGKAAEEHGANVAGRARPDNMELAWR
jgi:hypothetical protein